MMAEQMTVIMTVPNISKLDRDTSDVYVIKGIPWKIKVKRETNGNNGNQSLSVYLKCAEGDKRLNWAYAATASAKILPYSTMKNTVKIWFQPYVFMPSSDTFGADLIAWNELFNPQKNYVKNDTIRLEIEIKVADPREVNKTELICEQIGQTNTDDSLPIYRLTVNNIENLMAARTSEFNLRNTPWYFVVYKSRSQYLGINLCSKTVSENISCRIGIAVKLLSSLESSKHIETSYAAHDFNLGGYLPVVDFISWTKLLKQQNGFIRNGSIVLEVKFKEVNLLEMNVLPHNRLQAQNI